MAKTQEIFSKSKGLWWSIVIFVTIGNDGRHFERLLNKVDLLIKDNFDNFFVQFGNSKSNLNQSNEVKAFFNREEFAYLLERSDLIITHAGAGTLLQIAQLGKFPIVIPRLSKFKEHINDHQIDIATEFEKKGLCKVIYDIDELDKELILKLKKESSNHTFKNKNNVKLKNSLKNDFYKYIRL